MAMKQFRLPDLASNSIISKVIDAGKLENYPDLPGPFRDLAKALDCRLIHWCRARPTR